MGRAGAAEIAWAGAAEIAWEEATKVEARSKGMIPWDGGGTGGGRAGAAEIAWEEATNVEARSKGMIRWWDGRWTGWSCRNSMGGGYKRRSEIEGDDPVGRRWDGLELQK